MRCSRRFRAVHSTKTTRKTGIATIDTVVASVTTVNVTTINVTTANAMTAVGTVTTMMGKIAMAEAADRCISKAVTNMTVTASRVTTVRVGRMANSAWSHKSFAEAARA